jgi:hypothetical protein
MKQYRQGDVFIEEVKTDVKALPHKKVERDQGRIILAYGEATGHAHAILEPSAEMIELETGERFVISEAGLRIVHEEHSFINLAPGTYRINRQREYSPEEIRNVAD